MKKNNTAGSEVRTSLRMPESSYNALASIAEREKRSINNQILFLLGPAIQAELNASGSDDKKAPASE